MDQSSNPLVAVPGAACQAHDTLGRPLGLSQRMDVFAQLIAQYPDSSITPKLAAELYISIPGVKTTLRHARDTARGLVRDPRVQDRIALYRRVYGTNKAKLLADREIITDEMLTRWSNSKAAVRATDALQALRDREAAYGMDQRNKDVQIVLNNVRVADALGSIGVISDVPAVEGQGKLT